MSSHYCQQRPGDNKCFVCGRSFDDHTLHVRVERAYGDDVVDECRRCGVEWPCPAIKAINRNAKKKRLRSMQ